MGITGLLQIVQIILSVIIVILVLVQSKGSGLFNSFAGSIGFYRSRRGVERLIFIVTIVSAFLIMINSLLITIIK